MAHGENVSTEINLLLKIIFLPPSSDACLFFCHTFFIFQDKPYISSDNLGPLMKLWKHFCYLVLFSVFPFQLLLVIKLKFVTSSSDLSSLRICFFPIRTSHISLIGNFGLLMKGWKLHCYIGALLCSHFRYDWSLSKVL